MSLESQNNRLSGLARFYGLDGRGDGPLQDCLRENDLNFACASLDDLDAITAKPVVHVEGHIVSDDSDAHFATPPDFIGTQIPILGICSYFVPFATLCRPKNVRYRTQI